MGLSYHFSFSAPGATSAAELETFLQGIEDDVAAMGFGPVLVVNAIFDTPERLNFARQLTTDSRLASEKLTGVVLLREGQVWHHDPVSGSCRVIPKCAVLLVVTDEQKCETIFGFYQYPEMLEDVNGRALVPTHHGDRWQFHGYVNSPNPRFRKIIRRSHQGKYQQTPGHCVGWPVVFRAGYSVGNLRRKSSNNRQLYRSGGQGAGDQNQ